ncbi:MAG: hypothetical protein LQ346_002076 [Caloplaca aetnensis]|nr:MAG: hypothetical protein LQ346_002076 [Caloplaca aetnensis]
MILPLFATPKLLPRYAHIPYTPLAAEQQHQQRPNPSPRQRFFRKLGGYKISAVVLLAVAVIITTAVCLLRDPKLEHLRQPGAPVPVIPKDFRVVGLVFYGRRSRVEILDCYLKQNLKSNGGLLDEVVFLARTDNADDLAFLDRLVRETPGYGKNDLGGKNGRRASGVTYGQAWGMAVERGVMNTSSSPPTRSIRPASPGYTPTSAPSTLSCRNSHPPLLLLQHPLLRMTIKTNKSSTGAPPSYPTGPATRSLTPCPGTRPYRVRLTITNAGCPSRPPTTPPWPARQSASWGMVVAAARRG